MSKWAKLIDQIVRGTGDANIPFDDLCHQRAGVNAKPYQVRQVRDIIVRYKLGDHV